MRGLDRVSNAKAANIVIVIGIVLLSASFLSGLLNAFSDQYTFSPTGGAPSFKDRLQTFLNTGMNGMPVSALVIAAGFALRAMAHRTPPVAPSPGQADAPVPFEDVPVQLPNAGPITIDVVQAPVDDEIWRR